MPKQTIFISAPCKLRVHQNSLSIESKGREVKIPLEDIWVVVIESLETTITTRALSELCEAGIGTLLCGTTHMPVGLTLPIAAHSRHAAIVENQLLIPKPLNKRMWQAIVRQKIKNQATVLSLCGLEKSNDLEKLAKSVLSGDSNGREAVAASIYFREIAPNGGRRDSELTPLLDYGYAIIRAGIARCAVAGGWLVSRGIHHCSDLNAFNLVDDLIEPFRPIVDLIVLQVLEKPILDTKAKGELTAVFSYLVEIDGASYTVQAAIEELLDSFKRTVLSSDYSKLRLPTVIPLEKWNGEE